ncbi:MAG: sodium/proline symporter [Pseudomonadales bacterium]|jgi:SSS family transporter|nr:sodium/proline symporter [Pseudomonadales bacterium]
MITLSFLAFLALFIGVGVSAYRLAGNDSRDYLLASQSVKPWLAGLSAVATNNSGYMFIGVIGYTYVTGLPAIWMMIGWIAGDIIASHFVHARLRRATTVDTRTFSSVLATWDGDSRRWLRLAGGLLSIAFLGAYAAAQLTAGSKALSVLFGWESWVGATIGAVIVLAYCVAGGIRASIWTDAAQSLVMLIAMATLLFVAVSHLGGVASAYTALDAVSPEYMSLSPTGLAFGDTLGPALFVLGWMFAGASVIGQPHIMIRFMALDSEANMVRARLWYYGFFITFYFLANAVGLLSRVLVPAEGFDAELALPTIALELLPDVLVGLILAGVFAATMSTADSLVLACSASVTEDLAPRLDRVSPNSRLWLVKGATLLVTLLALTIALTGPDGVFVLVIVAWSALASAFAPLLLVQALGQRVSEGLALTMMFVGVATVYAWKQFPLLADFYEGMAGVLAGLAVFGLGRLMGLARSASGETADRIAQPGTN